MLTNTSFKSIISRSSKILSNKTITKSTLNPKNLLSRTKSKKLSNFFYSRMISIFNLKWYFITISIFYKTLRISIITKYSLSFFISIIFHWIICNNRLQTKLFRITYWELNSRNITIHTTKNIILIISVSLFCHYFATCKVLSKMNYNTSKSITLCSKKKSINFNRRCSSISQESIKSRIR